MYFCLGLLLLASPAATVGVDHWIQTDDSGTPQYSWGGLSSSRPDLISVMNKNGIDLAFHNQISMAEPATEKKAGSVNTGTDGTTVPGAKAMSMTSQSYKTVMTVEQIKQALPHRYPFLLVDRVIQLEKGVRAIGIKQVSANEQFFEGHFPQRPIMPGVLQIEALAQLAGLIFSEGTNLFLFMGVDGVKWRKPIVPGDTLFLEVEVLSGRRGVYRCRGSGYVGGQLAVEVKEMSFKSV